MQAGPSVPSQTAPLADANTEEVIDYEWASDSPIDLPDQLEIAQFDLLNYTCKDTTQVFTTGQLSILLVLSRAYLILFCRHSVTKK